MAQRFAGIGGSGMVSLVQGSDSKDVERHKASGSQKGNNMHGLLVALSLASLAFMPCVVSADAAECEMEETTA